MNQISQFKLPEQGWIDVFHSVENLIRRGMYLIPCNY